MFKFFVIFSTLILSAKLDPDVCKEKIRDFEKCPIMVGKDVLNNNCKVLTIGAKKVMGRLGNHLWGIMVGFGIAKKYGIQMAVFQETINLVKPFFEDFEHCPSLEEDFCGFEQFFEHFRSFIDHKIEEFYSQKAGKKLKFNRSGSQLEVPPEYGNRWKINYKELIDSKSFIEEYSPAKFITSHCPYEWEIFRNHVEDLNLDVFRCGRALLIQPGVSTLNDFKMITSLPNFSDDFFPRLLLRKHFIHTANKILEEVRKKHVKRKKVESEGKFIFVGIHSRGTDHIQYEMEKGFKPLKTNYFLDAMHLFRQHFKKKSKSGHLVFIYVSDEMESGRLKLTNRNKEQDLYFVGKGQVDDVEAIGVDLALLAICNHTIESHGSFSFFAGALSGGFRIVPQHFQQYVSATETLLPDPFQKPLPRIYSRNATENVYKIK